MTGDCEGFKSTFVGPYELKEFFNTKDEGKMEEYVGYSVIRKDNGKLTMHQPHLLRKIKREFGEELKKVR